MRTKGAGRQKIELRERQFDSYYYQVGGKGCAKLRYNLFIFLSIYI